MRRLPLHAPARAPLATALAVAALAACSDQPTAVRGGPADPSLAAAEQAPIYLVTFRSEVADVAATARDIARQHGFALRFVRQHGARGFSA